MFILHTHLYHPDVCNGSITIIMRHFFNEVTIILHSRAGMCINVIHSLFVCHTALQLMIV